MNKRVSMKDIATELNITVDAVCKALHDSPRISKKTKDMVNQKAKELGYIKNYSASTLKTGRTNFIAVFINSFLNPYFAVVTTKLLQQLKKKGFIGILCFCDKHVLTADYLQQVFTNNCEAVISLVEPNEEVINILSDSNVELYVLGIRIQNDKVNYVVSDDYEGGRLVAKEFKKGQYKKAMFITDSLSGTSDIREKGFLDELKEVGNDMVFVLKDNPETDMSKEVIKMIARENIDFIFCFSDYLANKVRRWILSFDNVIYKRIKIVGYDYIYHYSDSYDEISSVGYSIKDLCNTALDDFILKRDNKISIENKIKKVIPVKYYNVEQSK